MIVIDTHILIWAITDEHHKFSPKMIKLMDQASRKGELFVSEFTYLEVAMLLAKGRLEFIGSLQDYLEEIEFGLFCKTQKLNVKIIAESVAFDKAINSDPADRIILATAKFLNATLVTADKNMIKYGKKNGVKVIAAK